MDQAIIDLLRTKEHSARDLAVSLGPTVSEINSKLYTMLLGRRVVKGNVNPPKWTLNPTFDQVQAALTPEWQTTRDLASSLNLKTSEINPILYFLEKNGLATKQSDPDGKKPQWKLAH